MPNTNPTTVPYHNRYPPALIACDTEFSKRDFLFEATLVHVDATLTPTTEPCEVVIHHDAKEVEAKLDPWFKKDKPKGTLKSKQQLLKDSYESTLTLQEADEWCESYLESIATGLLAWTYEDMSEAKIQIPEQQKAYLKLVGGTEEDNKCKYIDM